MQRVLWLFYSVVGVLLIGVIGCPKTTTPTGAKEKSSLPDAGIQPLKVSDGGITGTTPTRPTPPPTPVEKTPKGLFEEAMNLASSNPKEAVKVLYQVAKKKPNLYHVWYNIGVLHHRLGDYAKAEFAYKQTLKKKPKFEAGIVNLIRLYLSQRRLSSAVAFVERMERRYPNVSLFRNKLIYLYIQQGIIQKDGSWFRRSENMARALQQKEEKNAGAIMNLGLVWYQQKKYELAARAFELAGKADPKLVESHYHLAFSRLKLQQQSSAVASLKKALKLNPNHPEANNLLGVIYLKQPGKVKDSFVHFNRAIEVMPQFKEAKLNLAIAWNLLGRHQEAADLFYKILQEHRFYVEPHYYLGILYLDRSLRQKQQSIGLFMREVPSSLQHEKRIIRQVEELTKFYTSVKHFRLYVARKPSLAGDAPARKYLLDAEKKLDRSRKKLKRLIKRFKRKRLRMIKKLKRKQEKERKAREKKERERKEKERLEKLKARSVVNTPGAGGTGTPAPPRIVAPGARPAPRKRPKPKAGSATPPVPRRPLPRSTGAMGARPLPPRK